MYSQQHFCIDGQRTEEPLRSVNPYAHTHKESSLFRGYKARLTNSDGARSHLRLIRPSIIFCVEAAAVVGQGRRSLDADPVSPLASLDPPLDPISP